MGKPARGGAMSEHDPAGTVDHATATQQIHETTKFLRKYEVALVTLEGDGAGENILITRLPFLVGRGKAATMRVSHETISRRHAELRLGANGKLELLDLGSSNGSYVNGEQIESAPVQDGDEIRFGSVRYQLLVDERAPLTYVAE